MKILSCWPVLILLFLTVPGCKKQTTDLPSENTIPRKVRFVLYTNKDFTNNNRLITFELVIQKLPNRVLWDSVLPPMRIKDIPGPANKLIIEKWVPGNDPALLKTGFYYTIVNVGNSWFVDSFKVGESLKTLDFNFR